MICVAGCRGPAGREGEHEGRRRSVMSSNVWKMSCGLLSAAYLARQGVLAFTVPRVPAAWTRASVGRYVCPPALHPPSCFPLTTCCSLKRGLGATHPCRRLRLSRCPVDASADTPPSLNAPRALAALSVFRLRPFASVQHEDDGHRVGGVAHVDHAGLPPPASLGLQGRACQPYPPP